MSSHPRRSSSIEEGDSAAASSGGGGLHHRRVGSNSLSSLKLSSSSRPPPLLQHQVSYSKNKDHENGGSGGGGTSFSSSSWLSLQHHKLVLYRKKLAAQKTKMKWVPHLIIIAAFMMMIMLLVTICSSNSNNHLAGSSIFSSTSSIMRCSSFLRSLKHQSNNESPQSRLILMASHLRHGPDGEMRLRIIEHNLRLLAANEPSSTTDDHGDSSNAKQPSTKSPLKAILLFSIDTQSTQSEIQTMINTWRNQISQNNDKHNVATNIISQIIYVPNDTTMVDASKWIVAIDQLLPEIQSSNARVMLINDSFVLTRPVPELWNDSICGEVCGLVWTASKDDPTRHIQSYVRTLSSCAVERYRRFYRDSSRNVHNVHELIEKFEMNLDWVNGGGSSEGVKALYESVGAHPDADEAQKVRVVVVGIRFVTVFGREMECEVWKGLCCHNVIAILTFTLAFYSHFALTRC